MTEPNNPFSLPSVQSNESQGSSLNHGDNPFALFSPTSMTQTSNSHPSFTVASTDHVANENCNPFHPSTNNHQLNSHHHTMPSQPIQSNAQAFNVNSNTISYMHSQDQSMMLSPFQQPTASAHTVNPSGKHIGIGNAMASNSQQNIQPVSEIFSVGSSGHANVPTSANQPNLADQYNVVSQSDHMGQSLVPYGQKTVNYYPQNNVDPFGQSLVPMGQQLNQSNNLHSVATSAPFHQALVPTPQNLSQMYHSQSIPPSNPFQNASLPVQQPNPFHNVQSSETFERSLVSAVPQGPVSSASLYDPFQPEASNRGSLPFDDPLAVFSLNVPQAVNQQEFSAADQNSHQSLQNHVQDYNPGILVPYEARADEGNQQPKDVMSGSQLTVQGTTSRDIVGYKQPEPIASPHVNKYSGILAAVAPPDASPLPHGEKVLKSGFVLARLSFRTIMFKKWKQSYWIQYGPHCMLWFRNHADFDDWLNNPYHTHQQRNFLIKFAVNFVQDLYKPHVRGYQVTQARSKLYGNQNMKHFKLERWMDYGPTIAAAFASTDPAEIDVLRRTLVECMRNTPITEGMHATGAVRQEDKREDYDGVPSRPRPRAASFGEGDFPSQSRK
jgi:hypothetical protein